MLYRFEAATAGTLDVVVSDDVGVDVDVHVLTAADGDACLARHDTSVSVEVEPGTVWIAVDTWVGSQEFPGAYLLTASFDGALGELPDPEPTDTGDTPDDPGPDDTDPPAYEEPADQERSRDLPRANRVPPKDEPGGCSTAPTAGAGLLGLAVALAGIRRRRR